MFRYGRICLATAALLAGLGMQDARANNIETQLLRAPGLPATCAPRAFAQIRVKTQPVAGNYAESLKVQIMKFAPRTNMRVFMTQLPNPPYGVSVYLGDVQTNDIGSTHRYFTGRFDRDVFVVAPGAGGAPTPHGGKDDANNPAFDPIHTYHIGLWFASPEDARKNNCPADTTPFNETHTAGVQLFNSRNAAGTNDKSGPLGAIFY